MFLMLHVCLSLLFFLFTPFCLAANTANTSIKHFDLPAQTLAAGLIEFALQAHTTIIVEDQLVANLHSHPVNGRLSAEAALSQLLTGTPLGFSFQSQTGSFLLQSAPTSSTPPSEHAAAPIEEVVVVGYLTYPFRYTTVRNSQQQANVSYFDSVRFTNVVPQQLIADQQTEDFAEVLKYASGVMPADGLSDTNDDIYMRGFHRSSLFLDGLRIGDTTGVKLLPANIERVEIIKGPATILYGQAEPGGTLNFISKKPTDKSFLHSEVAAGTLGKTRLSIDANLHTAALNSRLIIADQAQSTSADVRDIHRQLITPSISWQIDEQSHLDLQYQWQRNYQIANQDTNIPVSNVALDSFYQAYPERSPEFVTQFRLVNAQYNYYFNANWAFGLTMGNIQENRHGVRTSSDTLTNNDVLLKGQPIGEDIIVMPLGGRVAVPLILNRNGDDWSFVVGTIRSLYAEAGIETGKHADVHLNGTTETAGFEHKISIGVDWYKQDLLKEYTAEVNDFYPARVWKLANFTAVMNDISRRLFTAERPLGLFEQQASQLTNNDTGIFFADSITLSANWIMSLGARYSKINGNLIYFKPVLYEQETLIETFSTTVNSNKGARYPLPTHENFSSQFGLVYKPSESNSWYFNYSEAVRANYRVDAPDAKNAQPELSNQLEIGLKSLLFDGRFLSSIGLYKISKKNISEIVPKRGTVNSLNYFDQSVQGLDLDLTWQINSQLNIMGCFALLDAIVESGKQQGKKPADIADTAASLFAHYRFNSHWAGDVGLSYLGPRFGSTLGDKIDVLGQKAKIPAYSTVDLHLTYEDTFWSHPSEVKISIKNATNEYYYTAFAAGVRSNVAEERSVLASVRLAY
ncbi:MAG TPA: TonB-dependent receptor [Cellvibrionaceae bacterium]